MKFLHTSDLHLGKKLFEHSLLEDQAHCLAQIADIAKEQQVDALLLAGDIYDRGVPPVEAVTLLNDFLTFFSRENIPVLLIAGNHDSAERLSFGGEILAGQGIYVFGTKPDRRLEQVTFQDAYGEVIVSCLPYFAPAAVGERLSSQAVEKVLAEAGAAASQTANQAAPAAAQAASQAFQAVAPAPAQAASQAAQPRHLLMTHFFVTPGADANAVGTIDAVPAELFTDFDYVALGHIHRAYFVAENIRYCGSPLAYSFADAGLTKSVTLVELMEKGNITIEEIPICPLHALRTLKGSLEALLDPAVLHTLTEQEKEDYLQVTLTDTEELIDPMGTLRSAYPGVLSLLFEKKEAASGADFILKSTGSLRSTTELFGGFYELLRGEPLDDIRLGMVKEAAAE